MSLKDKLISSFIALDDPLQGDPYVYDIRSRAIKAFEEKGFPTKREEAWKYTSLNPVLRENYSFFPDREKQIDTEAAKRYFLHDIDTYKIVFVDGRYNSFLSETTHDRYDICLLSSAMSKSKYRAVIENYFNKAVERDGLSSLNTAFAREGAYIHISKNQEVDKPIEIINFATGSEPALMLQPRNLVVVQENAHVQIIERHQSLTDHPVLTNAVTEVFVARNATADHYKIQNDRHAASLIDHTFIEQEQGSEARMHTFSFGGKLTRNNLKFHQQGERCHSVLSGVTIIEGRQHVDHSTLVNHTVPNCKSHQEYKGIFADRATGVFNGRIVVEKEAQQTNAFQQNNNILIDDQATVNAKPQLEIFADDVRCSHGCTVGQLDEEALFYLRSRGIPKKQARALLMYAFAGSVLGSVKIPELKARITKLIAMKIGVNLGFAV